MSKQTLTNFALCQSFPYENQCESDKKLASRFWPVLFTLTYFFYEAIMWQQCLNFKLSKFKLQLNQPHQYLNFPKQLVIDYRGAFRTLSNI